MRTVFIGAGEVSVETDKILVKKAHEVIVIETDQDRIDDLPEVMGGGRLCHMAGIKAGN